VVDVIGLHHELAARAAVSDVATSVAGLHDAYQAS
jgi:hypothetical protein